MRVSIDVDVDIVLDELSDQDLVEVCRSRDISPAPETERLIAEAISAIRRGDALDAITILERCATPKWSAFDHSVAAYTAAIAEKGH